MRVLRVNETKVTTENAFNQDHFAIEGNHQSGKDKKTLLRCFSRFLTRVLNLRPIDFLEHYLIFATFKPHSVPFRIQKKGHSILH